MVADASRIIGVQRKRHLGEGEEAFAPAAEDAVFEHAGVKFGVAICAEADPLFSEVDLVASAAELSRLAGAVADGEGLLSSTASPGSNTLAGVEVKKTSGPGVLIRLDPERQILVISGDRAGRAVLADNLLSMASAEDGGHLHVDYFPGHFYLAEGSLSLVVNSPHGGMPTR